jgi:hypothetical protein
MTVDAAGVRRVGAAAELIGSAYARISYGGGRVFATSGEVVDARREVLIGNLGEAAEAIHVDTGLGRALVLDYDVVRALDINTLQSLGEISFIMRTPLAAE